MASFKFKHTIEGDINVISQADIDQLLDETSHEIKQLRNTKEKIYVISNVNKNKKFIWP